MSACPPKFADLHKSNDDAFNKDHVHGFFNIKMGQNFNMQEFGAGSITAKWNHHHQTSKSVAEFEVKSTCDRLPLFNIAIPKVTSTKTITDGGLLKYKTERSFDCGTKLTLCNDVKTTDWSSKSNSVELQVGRDRFTGGLKVNQTGGCVNMPDSLSANAVIGLSNDHFLAVKGDYNLKSGKLSHMLKLVANAGSNLVSVNVKDAADTEMIVTRKFDREFRCCDAVSFHLNNIHLRTQYGVKSADWGSQFCLDGKWNCGAWSTSKSMYTYDIKTNEAKFSDHLKVNDNLTMIGTLKNNFNDGLFKKCTVGAAFNFTA